MVLSEKPFPKRGLHGPSMFAVKTKIYGVIYNQSNSIAFDETSSYRSAQKAPNFSAFHWSPHGSLVFIGQHFVHEGSTFTERDRNKLNYRIGPKRPYSPSSDQAVRAVHSCNSWY